MHPKTIVILLVIFVFLIVLCQQYLAHYLPYMNYKELFTNYLSKKHFKLWMYWENPKGKTKPAFIKLCQDSVRKHCSKDFEVIMLTKENLYSYFPKMRRDIQNLPIPQKTDYIRLYALYHQGGIWLDSDIIVFKSLLPLTEKLKTYDFAGFGCHSLTCNLTNNGYGKPANWVLISRKNGLLMNKCLKAAHELMNKNSVQKSVDLNYHEIGRELIWNQIEILKQQKWNYHHFNSTCFERDRQGRKYTNDRFISKENPDPKCDYFFIPLYNTAPGFPKWFVNLNEKQLLHGEFFVSKLFRKALTLHHK